MTKIFLFLLSTFILFSLTSSASTITVDCPTVFNGNAINLKGFQHSGPVPQVQQACCPSAPGIPAVAGACDALFTQFTPPHKAGQNMLAIVIKKGGTQLTAAQATAAGIVGAALAAPEAEESTSTDGAKLTLHAAPSQGTSDSTTSISLHNIQLSTGYFVLVITLAVLTGFFLATSSLLFYLRFQSKPKLGGHSNQVSALPTN